MSKPRLLVVDDHHDTLRLFDLFFTMSGFDVVAADSGVEALRLLTEGCDAVVTDLSMPGMDGIEFIGHLRKRAKTMPIVAVTGHPVDPATVRSCRFFAKPCVLDEVADTVHELIAQCVHDCSRCPLAAGPV